MTPSTSSESSATNSRKNRRKPRAVAATDSEWEAIQEKAAKAGFNSISAYFRKVCLEPPAQSPLKDYLDQIPPHLQWEMLHAILLQHKMRAEAYEKSGKAAEFNDSSREVERRLSMIQKMG